MTTRLVRPDPIVNVFEQPFWDYVQQREFRLQRCDDCGKFRYPPSPVCDGCLSDRATWTEIGGEGRLLSWVVFHRQYFPELPVPYTTCAVELDEGPIVIANLLHAGDRDLALDLRVRIVFEDAARADGSEWVVPQWELVD